MEVAVPLSLIPLPSLNSKSRITGYCSNPTVDFTRRRRCSHLIENPRRTKTRIAVINEVPAIVDPAPVEVTWQIVAGALAGITPFVVAGIEFSKRIRRKDVRSVEGRGWF
ncbi:putative Transmembrane protein [Quillaja saponaria]|uniref:Transmembrane protein n=1 Tax=Quillaja saponaria TaxID=32244 RepID=A0AAD7LVA0_QUISA|nr:putative Transmembrane protein [Quillaja saponaria]